MTKKQNTMTNVITFIEEIWQEIKNAQSLYLISSRGQVKRVKSYVKHPLGGNKLVRERILKQRNTNGYRTVRILQLNDYCVSVHRLVAFTTVHYTKQESDSDRSIVDLVFYQLTNNISFLARDTVALYDNIQPIHFASNDLLSFWGFGRTNHHNGDDRHSFVDTAVLAKNYADEQYLYFSTHHDFRGNSGCPVYIHKNNLVEFVGMLTSTSDTIKSTAENIPDGNYDGTSNQIMGGIFTKQFIKYALEHYVK